MKQSEAIEIRSALDAARGVPFTNGTSREPHRETKSHAHTAARTNDETDD